MYGLNMKLKSRLILLTTLWDVLLTWVITRSLDYFVRWIARKFRLKGIHLNLNALLMNRQLTFFYLTYIVSFKESERYILTRLPFFHMIVKSTLRSHGRLHRYGILKTKSCRGCQIISENKNFLQGFEADEKLYPPFRFFRQKT